MTTNHGKAAWATRKAADLDAQAAALPKAQGWQERAQTAQTAAWLRSEAARFRAMGSRWAPDMAA